MLFEIQDVTVSNVWSETFKGRDGDTVEFYRALLNVPGEAPLQLAVSKDDFAECSSLIGHQGTAIAYLDARPGNRVRVYFKGLSE